MHDAIFRGQDSLGRRGLVLFALDAGVPDSGAFNACMAEGGRPPAIQDDIEAAVGLGGSGTPTVLINGLKYERVPDSARLKRLVRYHLDLSRDSLAHNGTRGEVGK
jgi:protein-disulfide isomerase